jgi:hypothetical protein
VLAYEDGVVGNPATAMVQRLCACGPGFTREQRFLAPTRAGNA